MNTETASGVIALDDTACAFTILGHEVSLTASEYRLLKALATKAGNLVLKSELMVAMYGDKPDAAESNVIEVLISRLRRKFAGHDQPYIIETVRGQGYRFTGAVQ